MGATDAEGRRRLLVEHILAVRRDGGTVTFVAGDTRVGYEDRRLRLDAAADERERLATLLSEYHVFKIKQPETRTADDGVVYLSAVTDAKHAADFVEALFRTVYGADEDYELRVE
ncbi:uncharacterized protein NP_4908A [Natronomonas pharaonis DSM 2160]|uniref:DUF7975 domain-containing protein n=1 Tax=Natronomonas pharaonis (strain ATCC 35678 / DSM 2160 / CIP 103997 / JCM 8858 / NBRC 14720 / NCIMB 2260 / Gabara) TaxID=348780 RepID=A0A1U7EZ35_NATPD|nr:hypothetical protein [Natronomonas pharaonis]CAI50545.2 uncharacterized protein NP_4908A [Natronomonas pharaonis DSM 2160]